MEQILYFIQSGVRILEGWFNFIYDKLTHHESETTKLRYSICKECEHNKHGMCSLCHCVIKAKVRCQYLLDEDGKAEDGCPLKKW